MVPKGYFRPPPTTVPRIAAPFFRFDGGGLVSVQCEGERDAVSRREKHGDSIEGRHSKIYVDLPYTHEGARRVSASFDEDATPFQTSAHEHDSCPAPDTETKTRPADMDHVKNVRDDRRKTIS